MNIKNLGLALLATTALFFSCKKDKPIADPAQTTKSKKTRAPIIAPPPGSVVVCTLQVIEVIPGIPNNNYTTLKGYNSVPAVIQDGQYVYVQGFYEPVAGDIGGGYFKWNANSTASEIRGTIVKPSVIAGSGRFERYLPSNQLPNVDHYGASFNATPANLANIIFFQQAKLGFEAAFHNNALVELTPNQTYFSEPIDFLSDKTILTTILGQNAKIFVSDSVSSNHYGIKFKTPISLYNLQIAPYDSLTPSSTGVYTFGTPAQAYNAYYAPYKFKYKKNFTGIVLQQYTNSNDNSTLSCVKVINSNIGISANGHTKQLAITGNCYFEGAYAALNFYACKNFTLQNSTFKGGSFAGVGMSSCQDVTVSGNYVFNPISTGINPGGAANQYSQLWASAFNIYNNTVYAGDCINMENGITNAIVQNNVVYVCPIDGSHGLGIGFEGHRNINTGNSETQQPIMNIKIQGNSINKGPMIPGSSGVFSVGIKGGNMSKYFTPNWVEIGVNPCEFNEVEILNNTINHYPFYGVQIYGYNTTLTTPNKFIIKDNHITNVGFGIQVSQISRPNAVPIKLINDTCIRQVAPYNAGYGYGVWVNNSKPVYICSGSLSNYGSPNCGLCQTLDVQDGMYNPAFLSGFSVNTNGITSPQMLSNSSISCQ